MRHFFKQLLCIAFLLTGSFANAQTPVLNFDGVNDFVNLGPAGDNLRTIELWFSPRNLIDGTSTIRQTLIARETNLTNNTPEFQLYFWNGSGQLRFTIDPGIGASTTISSVTSTWNALEWYHVAIVINPDPTIGTTMYVNGTAEVSAIGLTAATAPFPGTYINDFTALGCWGDFNQRFFAGRMEDIRFSTAPLYNANFTPPCPTIELDTSTVGLWNLNIGAFDSSPSGFDGIVNGAVWSDAFICENSCDCNANVSIVSTSTLTPGGNQTTDLLIDTGGELVKSICIELPYFMTTADPDCFLCDSTTITANGTILSGTTLGGVAGILDDPYGLGHARKICYEFAVPTAINETIQLDLQFPPVFDSPNCINNVLYCLDVEIKDEDCKMCEYDACLAAGVKAQGTVERGSFDDIRPSEINALNVLVYPIPATKNITVQIDDNVLIDAKVRLTSLDGKVLSNQLMTTNKVIIDLTDVAPGTYTLTVQTGDQKSTKKVIVN